MPLNSDAVKALFGGGSLSATPQRGPAALEVHFLDILPHVSLEEISSGFDYEIEEVRDSTIFHEDRYTIVERSLL